jgi:flagellar protein FlbD
MSVLIELTKMDTRKILVNSAQIETVEANPDTVLVLHSGRKLIVKESPEEIDRLVNKA